MRPIYKVILILLFIGPTNIRGQELKIADLGKCELISGNFIEDCKIGYRVFGDLNEARDNIIVIPSWFLGSSEGWYNIMKSGFMDFSGFYVVAFDALGNGISSSPSNSVSQRGDAFPEITIADMVNTQYSVLTDLMGFEKIYAVVGISMGGMQTYEWAFRYPEYMEKLVPIIGSPKLSAYDIHLWQIQYDLIEMRRKCDCDKPLELLEALQAMNYGSPKLMHESTDPDIAYEDLRDGVTDMILPDPISYDYQRQLSAMMTHDVYKHAKGTGKSINELLKADLFSIVVRTDHVVTPFSAIDFKGATDTELLILENDCGHDGFRCGAPSAPASVRNFLMKGRN
ncbi:alpha/beta fold hydrolase [Balneola sp. MJW-20]|uniref:alpha/beta fold hydrolase n=1 Tax=Gracilimonas aurantiaca TaxID=3234185 RepID=UPI003467B8AF